MGKTGIELPPIPKTGINANPEQVKALFDLHSETHKVNVASKDKLMEKLFSPNFLVFIVTILVIISGFIFMAKESSSFDGIFKFWQLILPIVTTYIGYAIGKGKQKDS
ncbi:hypothetical protein AAFX60_017255 [Aliivibrio fischeri]